MHKLWVPLFLTFFIVPSCTNQLEKPKSSKKAPVTVQVEPIQTRDLAEKRKFSGTLESPHEFVVSAKVGGRVKEVFVELSDPLKPSQIVGAIEDDGFQLVLVQEQADLEVAQANLTQAQSNERIAKREFERLQRLKSEGVATDSQIDNAQLDWQSKQAAIDVARSQVTRAKAALKTAELQLSYTRIRAEWVGQGQGFVTRRHVNQGDSISANQPFISVVELNPLKAIIYVTEKDYRYLKQGQNVLLTTQAHPLKQFEAEVFRISPSFNPDSRQARVELMVENDSFALKPGMFVQAEITLGQVEAAKAVPFSALVKKSEQTGIFVVEEASNTVRWCAVTTGIQEGEWVEIKSECAEGRVVVLGQHLLNDGAEIVPQKLGSNP